MSGPNPYAGMDADTLRRMAESDKNTARIIAARRAAAAALVARDPAPAQAARDAWEPLRQAVRGIASTTVPLPVPPPDTVTPDPTP